MILDNNVFSTFPLNIFWVAKNWKFQMKPSVIVYFYGKILLRPSWDDEANFGSKEKLISTFRASDRWEERTGPASQSRIGIPSNKINVFIQISSLGHFAYFAYKCANCKIVKYSKFAI